MCGPDPAAIWLCWGPQPPGMSSLIMVGAGVDKQCCPHGHCVPLMTNTDPEGLARTGGGSQASAQTLPTLPRWSPKVIPTWGN